VKFSPALSCRFRFLPFLATVVDWPFNSFSLSDGGAVAGGGTLPGCDTARDVVVGVGKDGFDGPVTESE
jgi:hypothetical protein